MVAVLAAPALSAAQQAPGTTPQVAIPAYAAATATLTFSPAAATRMACPPPLDGLERRLTEALASVRRFRIIGDTLELFDEGGATVALLEAVSL